MTQRGGRANQDAPTTATRTANREENREKGPSGIRFTPIRRGELLGHLGAGATLEEACVAVGVSVATVRRWQKKAQKDPAGEAAEFAAALDAARGTGRRIERRNLTVDDLIALLEERAAERKCLKSIELLLMRPWERQNGDRNEKKAGPPEVRAPLDELAARRSA